MRVRREGEERRRDRHWLDRRWVCAGLLLVAGVALGWLLGAWSATGTASRRRGWLTNPSLMWRAARLRAELPKLRISVDFEGYQRLVEARPDGAALPDCVSVELEGDVGSLPARACPLRRDGEAAGELPPLRLEVETDHAVYGMREAVLAPATPDLALAQQYLHEARAAGLPAAQLAVVLLSTNGSPWELYALEELPAASSIIDVWATPGDAVLSFDPDPAAPPTDPGLGSSFAHARWVISSRASDGSGILLDGALDAALQAATTAAAEQARAVFGDSTPADDVVEVELFGSYVALTAAWRGVLAPDWAATRLVYDAEKGRLAPLVTARAHRAGAPLPASLLWDPAVQEVAVQALRDLADPAYLEEQVANGDLPALYVALGGEGEVGDVLMRNQDAIRAWLEPARPLRAFLVDDPGYLHIALEAVQPYPVEIVGLTIAEQAVLEVETSWAGEVGVGSGLLSAPGIVMRGRVNDVPVVAQLRIPIAQLGEAAPQAGSDISVVTQVWGLSTQTPVPVDVGDGDG